MFYLPTLTINRTHKRVNKIHDKHDVGERTPDQNSPYSTPGTWAGQFPDISLEIEGCQSLVTPNVNLRMELLRPLELTVVPDSRTAYSRVGKGCRAYLRMDSFDVQRYIALVLDKPRGRFGQVSLMRTRGSVARDVRVLDE